MFEHWFVKSTLNRVAKIEQFLTYIIWNFEENNPKRCVNFKYFHEKYPKHVKYHGHVDFYVKNIDQ